MLNTGKHNAWAGFSFELLCEKHISQIKMALGIKGVVTYTSSWRSKEVEHPVQIDFLMDRNDHIINWNTIQSELILDDLFQP